MALSKETIKELRSERQHCMQAVNHIDAILRRGGVNPSIWQRGQSSPPKPVTHVRAVISQIADLMRSHPDRTMTLSDIKRNLRPTIRDSQVHAALDRSGNIVKVERGIYRLKNEELSTDN